jgi:RHS repeat-associated protein
MTRIDFADGSHNYFAWDADSKRVAADDSDEHTDFIYRDPDPLSLIMERDGAGQTKATYTLGDGLEAMRRSGTDYFYHFDWLGSTFALTDANEDITDTWRYDAWGNVLVRTGTTENPHTYAGRLRYYWRPDPVMYLLGVRMYNAWLGRFVSRDPMVTRHARISQEGSPGPSPPMGGTWRAGAEGNWVSTSCLIACTRGTARRSSL